jgi:hypothetical protein
MPSPLDPFIPRWDARERHAVRVRAPAALVYQAAVGFDLRSVPLVRAFFALRTVLMGSRAGAWHPRPFLEEMLALGWGRLEEQAGRVFVAGAECQPWVADVVFTPVPPAQFREHAPPGAVKIGWTLETRPLAPDRTELASETRVVVTDADAKERFRRYWRWARFGIIPIRWLLLPAIGRAAERSYRHVDVVAR